MCWTLVCLAREYCSGFRDYQLEVEVSGFWGLESKIQGFAYRDEGLGFRAQGVKYG